MFWDTLDAAASIWLSAVDIVAARMPARMSPARTCLLYTSAEALAHLGLAVGAGQAQAGAVLGQNDLRPVSYTHLCGTGEGAMLALNSFPGVICGHVEDPVDAYTFAHVNDGNACLLYTSRCV